MKKCPICNKLVDKDTRKKYCSKECYIINQKKLQQSDKYKRTKLAWQKRYRLTNIYKVRDKIYKSSEKRKSSLLRHCKTKKFKETRKRYSQTKIFKENQSKWLKTDKGRLLTLKKGLKRRASKNCILELFTLGEWRNKKEATKGICPGFNREPHYIGINNLQLDHIKSIAKAKEKFDKTGEITVYTINDIQPLCKSCNSRKQAK